MWPQDFVFVGIHRRWPSYDQLDECSWMLGFLRQYHVQKDASVQKNMLLYLVELLQDAVDFGWNSAKGAHFVLVNSMVDGLIQWKDLEGVQKLRERFCKSLSNPSSQNYTKFDKSKNLRQLPCFKFNKKGAMNSKITFTRTCCSNILVRLVMRLQEDF